MSREIKLTQGWVAIIDDEDFESLSQRRWYYIGSSGPTGYAVHTTPRKAGKQTRIWMHRIIMDAPRGIQVDHINSDSLDNRRRNLRLCTGARNNQNRCKHKKGSSRYKGVSQVKLYDKWHARIQVNTISRHIGYFDSEERAGRAYNQAALQFFGNFAKLNIIDPSGGDPAKTISALAIEPGSLHTFLPQGSGSLRLWGKQQSMKKGLVYAELATSKP